MLTAKRLAAVALDVLTVDGMLDEIKMEFNSSVKGNGEGMKGLRARYRKVCLGRLWKNCHDVAYLRSML